MDRTTPPPSGERLRAAPLPRLPFVAKSEVMIEFERTVRRELQASGHAVLIVPPAEWLELESFGLVVTRTLCEEIPVTVTSDMPRSHVLAYFKGDMPLIISEPEEILPTLQHLTRRRIREGRPMIAAFGSDVRHKETLDNGVLPYFPLAVASDDSRVYTWPRFITRLPDDLEDMLANILAHASHAYTDGTREFIIEDNGPTSALHLIKARQWPSLINLFVTLTEAAQIALADAEMLHGDPEDVIHIRLHHLNKFFMSARRAANSRAVI